MLRYLTIPKFAAEASAQTLPLLRVGYSNRITPTTSVKGVLITVFAPPL